MSDQTEIMKYVLDVSDVEAKAQRLQQLLDQLKAKRAAGEDTSEIERQVSGELDGLGKLSTAKKKDVSATDELLQSKQKLANVVQMLGGNFGGLIGQLGSVTSLLTAATPAAIGTAAALAAIAVGVKVFGDVKRAAEEATKAQEEYNEAVLEGQRQKAGQEVLIAERLAASGAATPENVAAATRMAGRLQKEYGLNQSERVEISPAATAVGASDEDAAVLASLKRRGVSVASPEEARHALDTARREKKYGGLFEEAQRYAATGPGFEEVVGAMMPGGGGGYAGNLKRRRRYNASSVRWRRTPHSAGLTRRGA